MGTVARVGDAAVACIAQRDDTSVTTAEFLVRLSGRFQHPGAGRPPVILVVSPGLSFAADQRLYSPATVFRRHCVGRFSRKASMPPIFSGELKVTRMTRGCGRSNFRRV